MPVLGSRYYDRFNYIYHPAYRSFYCDREYTKVGLRLGRLPFIERCIIRHDHRDYGEADDATYLRNDADAEPTRWCTPSVEADGSVYR